MTRISRTTRRVASGVLMTLSVYGCASSPGLDERIGKFREELTHPIPRTIQLGVVWEELNTDEETTDRAERAVLFGDGTSWAEEIKQLSEELGLCTDVRLEEQPGSDMRVTLRLTRAAAPSTRINKQSALLDVVVWSIFPPGAWWIGDVEWTPGLVVKVEAEFRVQRSGQPSEEWTPHGDSRPIVVPPQNTNLRERHRFVSWSTVGAVFVPSFVFSAVNPEQIEETLGRAIRREVGLQVARFIRDTHQNSRLFRALYVDSSTRTVTLRPGDDLGLAEIYQPGTGPTRYSFNVEDPRVVEHPLADGTRGLIRIKAHDRYGNAEWFSVAIDSEGEVLFAETGGSP